MYKPECRPENRPREWLPLQLLVEAVFGLGLSQGIRIGYGIHKRWVFNRRKRKMPRSKNVTLAVAVNDTDVLDRNLLVSPYIIERCQVIQKVGYPSAASAYNACIEEAAHDVIVFAHQDIYFPEQWLSQLASALALFGERGIRWGVLGCYGTGPGPADQAGCVYQTGMGIIGRRIERPEMVQTLDEIVLVIRKSSGLRFDPAFPHFHLYGADLCMTASAAGMPCYAIPAFCVHNTKQIINLPQEYWQCYRYFKKKWYRSLPVQTSCIEISRFDRARWVRNMREAKSVLFGARSAPAERLRDPREALKTVKS